MGASVTAHRRPPKNLNIRLKPPVRATDRPSGSDPLKFDLADTPGKISGQSTATLPPVQQAPHGPDSREHIPTSHRKIPRFAGRDQRTLCANAAHRHFVPATQSRAYSSANASKPDDPPVRLGPELSESSPEGTIPDSTSVSNATNACR